MSRTIFVKRAIIFIFSITCLFMSNPCDAHDVKPSLGELKLTPIELKWLKEHKSIKIAGPQNFPPFHSYDEKGILKGIAVDYILMMANQMGLFLEIQGPQPWSQVLEEIHSGKIDLIPCLAKTDDRDSYLNYSIPYLSFPLVILTRKDAPVISGIKDLHEKKLAVIKQNAIIEWLKQDNINYEPYYVNSPLERLKAVSFGDVTAGIENLATTGYIIQQYGLTNIKIAAPTPYGNYNLYMGIRKDLPELQGIINKIITWISPEQHMQIRNKWLSVRYEHGLRLKDIIKWIIGIGMTSGMVLIIILIWNRKLQKEIAARKKMEQELKRLALTDTLTGAHNRRSFWEKGANELSRAQRYNHPFSLLMMDIDHFKTVNDTYGHQVGDEVLKELVLQSNKMIRANDIMGRLGGEEFAIIFPETNVETALEVCERLRMVLSDIVVDSDQGPVQFTVSIGLSTFEIESDTLENIIQRADAALYIAKKEGRNRVVKSR